MANYEIIFFSSGANPWEAVPYREAPPIEFEAATVAEASKRLKDALKNFQHPTVRQIGRGDTKAYLVRDGKYIKVADWTGSKYSGRARAVKVYNMKDTEASDPTIRFDRRTSRSRS